MSATMAADTTGSTWASSEESIGEASAANGDAGVVTDGLSDGNAGGPIESRATAAMSKKAGGAVPATRYAEDACLVAGAGGPSVEERPEVIAACWLAMR